MKTCLLLICISIGFSAYSQAPANDNCSGAIELTVNTDNLCGISTEGTTIGATTSMTGCNYYLSSDDDVWYKFTATATTHKITLTANTLQYPEFQVFSGSCNSLTSIACVPTNYGVAPLKTTLEGLIIGQVYFIRVMSSGNSAANRGTFSICVGVPVAPANDNCANAITVPVNADSSCTSTVTGTTEDATQSMAACASGSDPDDDVWYAFTATSSAHIITLTTGSLSYAVTEIFRGSCGSLSSIFCTTETPDAMAIGDLTIGDTYYIRIYSYYSGPNNQGDFELCIGTPSGMPANDECSGALTATINTASCSTVTSATLENASGNLELPSCSSYNVIRNDVWFKLTATSTAVIARIKNAAFYSPYIQLLSGSCGNLTEIICKSDYTMSTSNLTIGEDYFIRVWSEYPVSQGQGDFDLCLSTALANSLPQQALTVPVNSDFTCDQTVSGDNSLANSEAFPSNSGCGAVDDGLWYKFVATNDSLSITITPGTISSDYLELYEEVSGEPDFKTYTSQHQLKPTDLIEGHTYYLFVHSCNYSASNRGSFEICIKNLPPPPANDNCDQAIQLAVNESLSCTSPVTGTTQNALGNTDACTGYADDDVWYKFTATAGTHILSVNPLTMSDAVFAIYEENCGELSALFCVNSNYGQEAETQKLTGLSIGSTYLVRVYSDAFGSGSGTFEICVFNVPPIPANDDCENAEILEVGVCTNGTNQGIQTTNYDYCAEFEKRNVWYQFTATAQNMSLTLTRGSIQNVSIDIWQGGCFDTFGFSSCDIGSNDAVITKNLSGLTVNATYWVTVSTREDDDEGTFELCLNTLEPPTNDECASAVSLSVQPENMPHFRTNGTTQNATTSMADCGSNPVANARDVWYSFVATKATHRIWLKEGTLFSPKIQVLTGTCGSLSPVHCSSAIFNSSDLSSEGITGLIPGETYFIRVYSTSNNGTTMGTFSIAITSPPVNDECNGAIELTPSANEVCSSPLSGSNYDATSTTNDCQFDEVAVKEVWYKFIATGTHHEVRVSNYSGNNPRIEIQSGTCATLDSVQCNFSLPVSSTELKWDLEDLTIGETYYLKLYSLANTFTSYSICILTIPNNPIDECEDGIALNVSGDMNPDSLSFSDLGATHSAGERCGTDSKDVWAKFTATSTDHYLKITEDDLNGSSAFTIYSGGCENLQILRCGNTNSDTLFGYGSLVPGSDYLIRFSTGNFNASIVHFNASVLTPSGLPANNNCAEALPVIPSTGENVFNFQTYAFGTPTSSINGAIGGFENQTAWLSESTNPNYDVWLKFTAIKHAHHIKVTGSASGNYDYEIYKGTCSDFTFIGHDTGNLICTEEDQFGNCLNYEWEEPEIILRELIPGETYFIRIVRHSREETYPDFQLAIGDYYEVGCLYSVPVIVESDQPQMKVADTFSNSPAYKQNVYGSRWFSFTATGSHQTVWADGFIYNPRFSLYSGSCDNLTPIFERLTGSPGAVFPQDTLQPGRNYYLVAGPEFNDDEYHGNALIGVTSATAPANDLCTNALQITVCTAGDTCRTPTYYSNLAAGNEGLTNCNGMDGPDVWFSFTASSETAKVILETVNGTEPQASLYAGTCGSLQLLKCNFENGAFQNILNYDQFETGETYFIRVFSEDTLMFKLNVVNEGKADAYPFEDGGCLGENLVVNPSFESYITCPTNFVNTPSTPGQTLIAGSDWSIPGTGSSDYFNSCAFYEANIDVPRNPRFGIQYPFSGKGYAGLFASSGEYREYLSGTLSDSLVINRNYLLSMYVSRADYENMAQNGLGIGLSKNALTVNSNTVIHPDTVIFFTGNPMIADSETWTRLTASFVSNKRYKHVYIGNFLTQTQSSFILTEDISGGLTRGYGGGADNTDYAYYFIDDVFVGELKNEIACSLNPCNQNLTLVSPQDNISNETVQRITNLEINANILIQGSSNVLFNSGKYIEMDGHNGVFEVKSGVVFEARIEGCAD